MCLTCGCMLPYERHGDERNIIVNDIEDATITESGDGITPQEAIDNLNKTWEQEVDPEVKNKPIH